MSRVAGQWLIAYDIACPRRLARVHRLLKSWGLPAQYSVFLVIATRDAIDRLVGELAPLLHPRQDDVRIYRLEPGPPRSLGAPTLPRGVLALLGRLAGAAPAAARGPSPAPPAARG